MRLLRVGDASLSSPSLSSVLLRSLRTTGLAVHGRADREASRICGGRAAHPRAASSAGAARVCGGKYGKMTAAALTCPITEAVNVFSWLKPLTLCDPSIQRYINESKRHGYNLNKQIPSRLPSR